MNIQKTENFNKILSTIQNSKQKALQQVNSTFIELYQNIGKHISTKTIKENMGKNVVKKLAIFLKTQDPTIKGYTTGNMWNMKQFYLEVIIVKLYLIKPMKKENFISNFVTS